MKIILDNVKFADQKAGGVSAYWYELIIYLINNNADFKMIEHKRASKFNIFRSNIQIDDRCILPDFNIPIKILRYLPVTKKLEKNSIFHSSYYRFSPHPNIFNITTVHDFTYEKFRSGFPRFLHHFQKKQAIFNSHGVICISNNTKKDLLDYFPSVPESKITVIHHGISDDYFKMSMIDIIPENLFKYLKDKYIIFIGDRAGYKNFDIVLKVLHQLPNYHLLIVGGGNLSSEERNQLEEKLGGRYHHLTGIDNKQLNILYNNAFCMIYPSCYEGFGMPVAEAMKAGCPVVTTRTSSIPEVGGDAILMVDDIGQDDFISKIKLLENHSLRLEIIDRGLKRAKDFSWEITFKKTYEFYEHIYAKYSL